MLLYAIIIFDSLNAASVNDAKGSNSENIEMHINNTSHSIRNLSAFKGYELHTAVMEKLKEIFRNQFPNSNFDLRLYEIENWPSSVDLNNSYGWRRRDLVIINEGIPFYRFFLRGTFANYSSKRNRLTSKDTECLEGVQLKKEYFKRKILRLLFERFKTESGHSNASKINWKLLDRSQVPEKYNNIMLNSMTVSNQLIFKNPEIIDNIHFHKCSEVDKEPCDKDHKECYASEASKSKPETEYLEIIMDCDDFEDEIGDDDNSTVIPELDIDLTKFDSNFEIEICGSDEFNKESIKEFDQLDFSSAHQSPIESIHLKDIKEQRKMLKNQLTEIFKVQFPNEVLKMRNYIIHNWPEGVSIVPTQWSRWDIKRIQENINDFVFLKRLEPFSMSSEFGMDILGNMDVILNQSWTKKEVNEILMNRYRTETGKSNALLINWDLVDRRAIPAKYDGIEFNSISLKLRALYKNPEIVDNIHFFKEGEIVKTAQRKRKFGAYMI